MITHEKTNKEIYKNTFLLFFFFLRLILENFKLTKLIRNLELKSSKIDIGIFTTELREGVDIIILF